MGKYFADQYSLLHFSVGVIAYFWNVPLIIALLIHVIFEIVENTEKGMSIINNYFVGDTILTWPGKKTKADTFVNIVGDNVFFVLGWVFSKLLDESLGNHL
tara:strand:+ start:54 stop:356 length:303 start_codon:yes stop_codon:yes gene_type:complete